MFQKKLGLLEQTQEARQMMVKLKLLIKTLLADISYPKKAP
jgi:hypothetical protein